MKKFLLPIMTATLFSGSFIAAKYATVDLGPLTTSFLRYVIALVFLTSLIVHFQPTALRIKKKDIFKLTSLGLFGITGYHFFFFSSLKYTLVTNTGIINAFSPLLTGLLAAIFIKERLSLKSYFGIFIAFVGVLILITKGKTQAVVGLDLNFGDFLMVLAVINWAIYSLLIKNLSTKYSNFTLTYYATASGVIILLFLALFEEGIKQIRSISIRSILSLMYMGIFASGLGYLLYNYGIRKLGPTKISSLVYSCVPVFVAILSVLFFKETFTLPMVFSVVLIIMGLNVALLKNK